MVFTAWFDQRKIRAGFINKKPHALESVKAPFGYERPLFFLGIDKRVNYERKLRGEAGRDFPQRVVFPRGKQVSSALEWLLFLEIVNRAKSALIG